MVRGGPVAHKPEGASAEADPNQPTSTRSRIHFVAPGLHELSTFRRFRANSVRGSSSGGRPIVRRVDDDPTYDVEQSSHGSEFDVSTTDHSAANTASSIKVAISNSCSSTSATFTSAPWLPSE